MQEHLKAWRHLAERAIEPNVFAEPEFVLPGVKHWPEGRRVAFLLVWHGDALRALVPVVPPRRFAVTGTVSAWRPLLSSSGVPLIDRTAPDATLERVLGSLAARDPRTGGLAFPQVPETGPFAAVLRAMAGCTGRSLTRLQSRQRPVLAEGWRALDAGDGGAGRDAFHELRRRRQDLATLGPVSIDQARDPRQVRDAIEEFLVLEAGGRMGSRGEATIQNPGAASVMRVISRSLARARRLRVDVLRLGTRPVAAAIVVTDAAGAWLWKTTEDESLAHLSPRAQLMLEMSRGRLERPRLDFADPAGPPDDLMIEALWPARTAVADYLVSVAPQPSAATKQSRDGWPYGMRAMMSRVSGPRAPR